MALITLVLLATSCHRHQPAGTKDTMVQDDTADSMAVDDTAAGDDTGHVGPAEECNGLDDDEDGEIDEGFPDSDSDGLADCIDSECAVEGSDAEELATVDGLCAVEPAPPTDPWDIEVLWEMDDGRACANAVVADVDGDGVGDIACTLVNEDSGTSARAISGVDGTILWTTAAFDELSPIAVADLDGDGQADLAGINGDGLAVSVGLTGTVQWTGGMLGARTSSGSFLSLQSSPVSLEVVDVDSDGTAQLVGHHAILDGATGLLATSLDSDSDVGGGWISHEIAAVDMSDNQVLLSKWHVWNLSHGRLVWESERPEDWYKATVAVPLQLDGDDNPEIAWLSEERVQLADSDGRELLSMEDEIFGERASFPCAADLDGDGAMELIMSTDGTRSELGIGYTVAMKGDGSFLWQREIAVDRTALIGCSVFDFDLDGTPEVVTYDEASVYILEGATGDVLWSDDRQIIPIHEYPLIVDLDGDGSVELVFAHGWNGGNYGPEYGPTVRVYSHVDRAWPPGSRQWSSPRWSGHQLQSDGSLPRTPKKPWLDFGIWRGQPSVLPTGVDLTPEIIDSCVSSCDDGEVRLSVRLVNQGPEEAMDAAMSVYAVSDTGDRDLLTTLSYEWIDDAWATSASEILMTVDQARSGLLLVAGDDGSGTAHRMECASDNDELTWRLDTCD